ncbi:MAG: sigma-70 family RNA polymerase sigma factor [Acidobacteriota bacterium]
MADDDRELVARIQQGDGESFGVLYDRTRDWLRTFVIVPRVGAAEANDVLAETYRTALAGIRKFEWRGIRLLHWLSAIARRKSLERARRQRRQRQLEDDVSLLDEFSDDLPTAEAAMIYHETMSQLRTNVAAALGRLRPRYAEALRLRLLEGRPRDECAQHLEVSPATFDVVLCRATRAFAREWRQE